MTTTAVLPTRHSENYSTHAGGAAAKRERRLPRALRGTPRDAVIDLTVGVVAAFVLGLTVGFLLADIITGVAVTLGTAVAFRLVLRTLAT